MGHLPPKFVSLWPICDDGDSAELSLRVQSSAAGFNYETALKGHRSYIFVGVSRHVICVMGGVWRVADIFPGYMAQS